MNVREYRPKDKLQIVSLMVEFGPYLEDLDPMGRTKFAPNGPFYFTNKLLRECKKNKGMIFVAEESNRIVGFIGGYIKKQDRAELMEAKKAVPGVITEFFVTQNSRHKGLGSILLKKMEDYLKYKGCTLIRFDVFAPNTLARNFYSKHGYQDRSIIMSKDI